MDLKSSGLSLSSRADHVMTLIHKLESGWKNSNDLKISVFW